MTMPPGRLSGRAVHRAFGQLILTTVLVGQGRHDEGCTVAHEVLDTTQSLGSVLVLEQLRDLQHVFEPYRANRVVADPLRRLADVLPERRSRYPWMAGPTEDRTPADS